jgi:hypothetical protein
MTKHLTLSLIRLFHALVINFEKGLHSKQDKVLVTQSRMGISFDCGRIDFHLLSNPDI